MGGRPTGRRAPAAALLAAAGLTWAGYHAVTGAAQPPGGTARVTWADIAVLPVAPATARLAYGPAPQQVGDLRLPPNAAPAAAPNATPKAAPNAQTARGRLPVVVLLHGGCWQNAYGVDQVSQAASALARAGVAVWTPEYRRLGDPGGGWPGTFADVARAVDFVRTLAARYPLDTGRVVLAGHSAGGHLALWAAARRPLPPNSAVDAPAGPALRARGVVSLAGIADLAAYAAGPGGCNRSAAQLVGGTPGEVPARYRAANPILRTPLGVPVRLVHGAADDLVPLAQSLAFAARDSAAGGDARTHVVAGVGHFDLIAPSAPAWPTVVAAVRELLP